MFLSESGIKFLASRSFHLLGAINQQSCLFIGTIELFKSVTTFSTFLSTFHYSNGLTTEKSTLSPACLVLVGTNKLDSNKIWSKLKFLFQNRAFVS